MCVYICVCVYVCVYSHIYSHIYNMCMYKYIDEYMYMYEEWGGLRQGCTCMHNYA